MSQLEILSHQDRAGLELSIRDIILINVYSLLIPQVIYLKTITHFWLNPHD